MNVRVLNKLVCGKMCGFSENRPKSGGFDEKNSGNSACAPKSPTEGHQKKCRKFNPKTKMAKYI